MCRIFTVRVSIYISLPEESAISNLQSGHQSSSSAMPVQITKTGTTV